MHRRLRKHRRIIITTLLLLTIILTRLRNSSNTIISIMLLFKISNIRRIIILRTTVLHLHSMNTMVLHLHNMNTIILLLLRTRSITKVKGIIPTLRSILRISTKDRLPILLLHITHH